MLLEFTVGNYKSFKEPVTLSMVASSLKEHDNTHTFSSNKYKLLKSEIIYGANASGKSNLFKALTFMKNFVFSSAKETQISEKIDVDNFKLSTETEHKPSHFEIIFMIDEKRYRYGFKINKEEVEAEWLFYVPTSKEANLFIRTENNITLGAYFKEGNGIEERTRNNALFLSVVAQFNGEISKKILNWFSNLNGISGLNDKHYMGYTTKKLNDPVFRQWVLNYLKIADIDILDVQVDTEKLSLEDFLKLPQKKNINLNIIKKQIKYIQDLTIKTNHQKYDKNNNKVDIEKFDLEEDESKGTQKLLALAGPIWDTLKNGKILFIDEFDTRLHQILTISLVKLFNSSKSNFNKAQFILTTHDTNLLDSELFRRDQIWFINKDKYGVSELFSLAEYKKSNKIVRKDASYAKNYLRGKYGAVPLVDNFDDLFGE